MKYGDASALLRVLFIEPGPVVALSASDRVVSSQLVEIESYRLVQDLAGEFHSPASR